MTTKRKTTVSKRRNQYATEDEKGNRQFIIIVGIATVALVGLLYYIFIQQ